MDKLATFEYGMNHRGSTTCRRFAFAVCAASLAQGCAHLTTTNEDAFLGCYEVTGPTFVPGEVLELTQVPAIDLVPEGERKEILLAWRVPPSKGFRLLDAEHDESLRTWRIAHGDLVLSRSDGFGAHILELRGSPRELWGTGVRYTDVIRNGQVVSITDEKPTILRRTDCLSAKSRSSENAADGERELRQQDGEVQSHNPL